MGILSLNIKLSCILKEVVKDGGVGRNVVMIVLEMMEAVLKNPGHVTNMSLK